MSSNARNSDSAFDDFLRSYWSHREQGTVEPLSFYLSRFPGAEEQITAEYLALGGERSDLSASKDLLGPFRLIHEIGRGGQGVVHLAEDTRLRRRVALKVLPMDGRPTAEQLARFDRESRLASRLEHRTICPVYEAGHIDGKAFIAMRWIEGHSLAHYLTKASAHDSATRLALALELPPLAGEAAPANDHARLSRILSLIEAIARGLHAAHVQQVVHRDLKPANVIVEASGHPVILDFGLSKDFSAAAHSLTESGAVFGTPNYMSPEQVRGDHRITSPATDVYALGVLMFACLTLKLPFERATQADILLAICNDAPERARRIAPFLPKEVDTVLERALAKSPNRRFASAELPADELARIRTREPIRTKALGSVTRTWRWAQRNPRLAASLGGILVALSVGLVVALVLLADIAHKQNEAELIADIGRLELAETTARTTLKSIDPSKLAEYEAWFRNADRVRGRRAAHEMARALQPARADLIGELSREPTRADLVDGVREGWPGEMSRIFLERLDRFEDEQSTDVGSYWRVLKRYRVTQRLQTATIEEVDMAWKRSNAEVAANRVYKGLELEPQLGLIPLGGDPSSGLLEFAVYGSGSVPRRDEDGRLLIDEESAIVLILVPGWNRNARHPGYVARRERRQSREHLRTRPVLPRQVRDHTEAMARVDESGSDRRDHS